MIAQPQSTTSSGYGVQVGAFFDWKRLHMALGEINNKGIPNTMVQIGQKDGKEIFRILIGPYASKAEAERMRSQLANKGVKGLSVSLASLK
ncbi:MAG: SPOR domain-containing protein [Bacteroidota bacterium]